MVNENNITANENAVLISAYQAYSFLTEGTLGPGKALLTALLQLIPLRHTTCPQDKIGPSNIVTRKGT